jgi:uncharacterized protein
MTDTVQTAAQLYAALQEEDVSPFISMCADDVTVQYPAADSLPYGGRWHGRDGVAAFLDAHDAAEEILEFDVGRLVADGELVVAIGTFTGRAKPRGSEWTTAFVHLLTIRDGRLYRWEAIFDTATAIAAHA